MGAFKQFASGFAYQSLSILGIKATIAQLLAINPLETAPYHQLCAPRYRPIVDIQCERIPIPTNITGTLDHCTFYQYYW